MDDSTAVTANYVNSDKIIQMIEAYIFKQSDIDL